jgi:hypothetical protein
MMFSVSTGYKSGFLHLQRLGTNAVSCLAVSFRKYNPSKTASLHTNYS